MPKNYHCFAVQVKANLEVAQSLCTIKLLSCASLTDDSLLPLSGLDFLECLTLKGAYNISNKIILNLRRLPRLKHLCLTGARRLRLAVLNGFPALKTLDLSDCTALATFIFGNSLPPLEAVNAQGCTKLSDDGLNTLEKLSNLRAINLNATSITDITIFRLQNIGKIQVGWCMNLALSSFVLLRAGAFCKPVVHELNLQ